MKIDLKDVTLMIHFRKDIEQRLINLQTVVRFYRKTTTNLNIIIVNDDSTPTMELKKLHTDYNCVVLFLQNTGIYHRTKAFNEAAKITNRKFLIAGDTDVFINPLHIKSAIELFEQNPKVGVIYPYCGMFVHLKKHNSEEFEKTLDITPLEDLIYTLKPMPYFETENFLVAHPMSKGGTVMFTKDAYNFCGGYNTNFIGWGFEDDEISNRYTKLGFELERVKDTSAIAWHLPHDNTIREKHPFYQQNYQHSEFVGHASKEQLEEYIKTWKL